MIFQVYFILFLREVEMRKLSLLLDGGAPYSVLDDLMGTEEVLPHNGGNNGGENKNKTKPE